jgi:hypothetical protein
MKNNITNSRLIIVIVCTVFMSFLSITVNAQKKQKARVKVSFIKVGNVKALNISGKYKEHRKYKPAKGLELNVYQTFENDSIDLLGSVTLNKSGKGKINVDKAFTNKLENYSFKVSHIGSKKFKKVSKSLSVKVANLKAELKGSDKKPIITATFTDAENNPIEGVELNVNLQRLFSPLSIGKGPYFTDKDGTINVPITVKMPGIDGKLNYEVVLDDSDDYGTIKTVVNTKIGSVIKDLSTFDQRTMWSPPQKAPWADIIIPNMLIFGIWIILFYLIFNLYRISKQKNV